MGGNNGGGGSNGGGSVDYSLLGQQQMQAALMQAQQQAQWQAEQNKINQANDAQNLLTQQGIDKATQTQNQEAINYRNQNIGQGQALDATGGANGIKAAATMGGNTLGLNPVAAKLQAAGDPGSMRSLLNDLLKKRATSQSNVVGMAGNSLAPSQVALGGSA